MYETILDEVGGSARAGRMRLHVGGDPLPPGLWAWMMRCGRWSRIGEPTPTTGLGRGPTRKNALQQGGHGSSHLPNGIRDGWCGSDHKATIVFKGSRLEHEKLEVWTNRARRSPYVSTVCRSFRMTPWCSWAPFRHMSTQCRPRRAELRSSKLRTLKTSAGAVGAVGSAHFGGSELGCFRC